MGGFVTPDDGPDLFIHARDVLLGRMLMMPGAHVSFVAVWDDEKKKYEASDASVLIDAAGATPKLPPDFAETPPPDTESLDAEAAALEKVTSLDFFIESWELDKATGLWLARLDPEVQQALCDEFEDAPLDHGDSEKVILNPTRNLFIAGLPKGFSLNALQSLLKRFGKVTKCRLASHAGFAAFVQMRSVEEAILVME